MYESPETNIEPATSTSDGDNHPTVEKAPDEVQDAVPSESIENVDAIEEIDASKVTQKNDTELEEIRIVAVASAVTDDSIKQTINDEQEPDDKSTKIKTPQPDSTQSKPPDDRSETRVISLDTIIRKGLNEQMPMTAKDIDNIVPNAIKQQQNANLKQSEKLAASEKEFELVYESSDYNSSCDEKFEDDDFNEAQPIEEKVNNEADTSGKVDTTEENENENQTPQLMCEALLEEKADSNSNVGAVSSAKDINEKKVESIKTNSNESNDSSASDHSSDDSGSDSTHSSQKKQKRRKRTASQNKVKEDVSKNSETIDHAEETSEIGDVVKDPEPRLNRRGKPRKSYDETDTDQVMKKAGRKLKIQRYSGPKRTGIRVGQQFLDFFLFEFVK